MAPVVANPGNQTVNELATLAFTATATDADLPANTLSFSLDAGAPAGATIGASTGAFSWTPTEAQGPGSFPVTIRATDNGSPALSGTAAITITVNEVNVAPVVTNPGNKTTNELVALAFTVTATDADLPANTITWSLDAGAPAGATIGAGTGAFSWTPAEIQGPGSYPVTIRATDNGSPALSGTAAITITVNEVNVAPVLGYDWQQDGYGGRCDHLHGERDGCRHSGERTCVLAGCRCSCRCVDQRWNGCLQLDAGRERHLPGDGPRDG